MTYINGWLNSTTDLFDITADNPRWIENTDVATASWLGDASRYWEEAQIVVSGGQPELTYLLGLGNGVGFHITRREYGPRREYEADKVILKIENGLVVGKGFTKILALHPDEIAPIRVSVTLKCLIRFFNLAVERQS